MNRRNRSGAEIVRRVRLHELDELLSELEILNLLEVEMLPVQLSNQLRSAGIAHPEDASVTEALDLVFRAQAVYLRPGHGTRRWSAA